VSSKGISFRLFGFPVLYRWTALAIPAYFGFQLSAVAGSPLRVIETMAAFGLAIGAAILIHELGHALTARAFGGVARIELVLLGGLTHHRYDKPVSNGQRALVSVAGSVAGALASLIVLLLFSDTLRRPDHIWEFALQFFVYAGLVWGVFNLIPFPGLDGSHILDAGVRAIAPEKAGVIVPVVSAVFGVAAIIGIYLWQGSFAALWLVIIFGPELVSLGSRIRRGRDESLYSEAVAAETAYRRGDLEAAATQAEKVLEEAQSEEIIAPMVDIRRASLSRLGRYEQLLAFESGLDGRRALPPVSLARVLARVGRLAEAESLARSQLPEPEAVAFVVELVVDQDARSDLDGLLGPESARLLVARVAEVESTHPQKARSIAALIASAPSAPPKERALARLTLGETPDVEGLGPVDQWALGLESAARRRDGAAFEHALRAIPDQTEGRVVQGRLHELGLFDHAARLGTELEPDAATWWLLARSFGRLGDTDRALWALEAAAAAGWRDATETAIHPDFAAVRTHPRWAGVLERMLVEV